MFAQADWRCPYCGAAHHSRVDSTDFGARLETCDANQGGCGSLVVINVARVEVLLRVRRVEGEGVGEDRPLQMPEPMQLPEPVVAQPEEPAPTEPEPEPDPEPMPTSITIAYKWRGLYHEVDRMQAGRRFSELPKSARLELIKACGQQIAAHLQHAPSMGEWDIFCPFWMPGSNGIQKAYLSGVSWRSVAQGWLAASKGQVTT